MGTKTYPSKSQPVKPMQQRGQVRQVPGVRSFAGPSQAKHADTTRKSKVYEQGNPYRNSSTLGRDDDTMMRNRMGNFAENPKEPEPMPEGNWPAKNTTISGV